MKEGLNYVKEESDYVKEGLDYVKGDSPYVKEAPAFMKGEPSGGKEMVIMTCNSGEMSGWGLVNYLLPNNMLPMRTIVLPSSIANL